MIISFLTFITAYTWVDECNEGRIIHHLRYNSRKAIVDLNEFFYNGIKAEEVKEKEWLKYLVNYSNRTSNFGFMNNWRQIFGISGREKNTMNTVRFVRAGWSI